MEIVVIKSELEPILFLIVSYAIKFWKEYARFVNIFIACIRHKVDKTCDRIYLTSIPCWDIKEASALFAKFSKTLKFISQLKSMEQASWNIRVLLLIYIEI